MINLTQRQQSLIQAGALAGMGDQPKLENVLNEAFDHDLTVSELKEALSQVYAYAGFPRSLNALGTLQRVIETRTSNGQKVAAGTEATPLPAGYNALREGTRVQTQLSGAPFNYTFAPQTDYYLKAHLFGDIFARDNLTFADRELVTLGIISSLPGCEPQLTAHCRGALNMGVKPDELHDVPAALSAVNYEAANRARKIVATVLSEGETAVVGEPDFVYPKGEFNSAYAQYFIGNSYLYPMDAENGGPVNVTFEPRCRNNWHIHHKSVQVLICVSGRGWYQEWGKEPIEMTPGTVVAIPAEAKHWHGAAKDSWFQHLTYMTKVESDASNEWLEPVVDDVYNKLP